MKLALAAFVDALTAEFAAPYYISQPPNNDTGSDPTDQAKSRVYPLSREPSRVGHEQSRVFAESVVIMRYEGAKAFKSHTLAIELNFRYYSSIFRKKLRLSEWDEPSHFIVACEDLSQFVRALLIISHTTTGVGITLLTE